jgi:DNA-binding IclR family transcriptional regulator
MRQNGSTFQYGNSFVSVANVDRCLNLIEILADNPPGIGLSSLADQLAMPLSAVHRLLGALIERGYVRQDPATHLYEFTLRFAAMGFRFLDSYPLPDAAQSVLAALARDTGDYCRLALVQDTALTWVARAQGATEALRYDPPMGRPVALHATAAGKAWLATLPEEEALRIVFAQGFPVPRGMADRVFGRNVLRTVEALRQQLAVTRSRGHAVAVEEAEPGVAAMAVVFRSPARPDGAVVGTVSLAGPIQRVAPPRYAELAIRLHRAGAALAEIWALRRRQAAA